MNKNLLPENSIPFNKKQKEWLSGLISGLRMQLITQDKDNIPLLNILYGTQTGNSEQIAYNLASLAEKNHLKPQVKSMGDISIEDFSKMINLVIIISTYGEGDMPDSVELLWENFSKMNLNLSHIKYSLLALGDSSYTHFCLAGKQWDEHLEKLGAKSILKRVDCDVDFEKSTEKWNNQVITYFSSQELVIPPSTESKKKKFTAKNPYLTKLKKKKLLSKKGSGKEIWHYEIHLEDEALAYSAGDCLGVLPVNSENLVKEIIDFLGLKHDEKIGDKTLFEKLKYDYEIRQPNKRFLNYLCQKVNDPPLKKNLQNEDKIKVNEFLWGKETLTFLKKYPLNIKGKEFLDLCSPLKPRIYSISSSYKTHPKQVHLTIASVRYTVGDIEHHGVCSTFLADDINIDDTIRVYLIKNNHFKIPANHNDKMIMVGPGTGLAPFRAFLQERAFYKSTGENWLFFGDRNKKFDYLYEDEIQYYLDQKILHRLDLAFSRDQKEKIYVQTKMLEKGKELFQYLEDGAYFYVCGDAKYMAKDVHQALYEIIKKYGKKSEKDTQDYIAQLKKDKRYIRDVY